MNIHDSEIFLKHPLAGTSLKKEKKYHNLEMCTLVIMALGLIMVAIVYIIRGSKVLGEETIVAVFFAGIGSMMFAFMAGMNFNTKKTLATQDIEQKIKRLALLLGVTVEELCGVKAWEIASRGRTHLVKRAKNVLIFQKGSAQVSCSQVPTVVSRNVENCLHKAQVRRTKKLSDFYDLLREFNLIDAGGYGWAFDEARKLVF